MMRHEQTEDAISGVLRAGLSHAIVEQLPTEECCICNEALRELRRCIRVHGQREVRAFATFLTETTQRTVQREKLQSFATEFLNAR